MYIQDLNFWKGRVVTGSTYVKWVCEKVLLKWRIAVCVIARLALEQANLKGSC